MTQMCSFEIKKTINRCASYKRIKKWQQLQWNVGLTLVLSSMLEMCSCMGILKLCRKFPPNTSVSTGVYTAWIQPKTLQNKTCHLRKLKLGPSRFLDYIQVLNLNLIAIYLCLLIAKITKTLHSTDKNRWTTLLDSFFLRLLNTSQNLKGSLIRISLFYL